MATTGNDQQALSGQALIKGSPDLERARMAGVDLRPMVKVILVVDGSTSMNPVEDKTQEAMRELVETLRSDPDTRYRLSYVWFAGAPKTMFRNVAPEEARVMYSSDGSTALWDALKHTFVMEMERMCPVICVTISDGEDVCSRISPSAIEQEVKKRLGWGNWSFAWLGMEGASRQAPLVGIDQFIDFSRGDIKKIVARVADRIKLAAAHMRVTGTKSVKLLEAVKGEGK